MFSETLPLVSKTHCKSLKLHILAHEFVIRNGMQKIQKFGKKKNAVVRRLAVGPTGRDAVLKPARDSNPESPDG
jgi:hypothetical protein